VSVTIAALNELDRDAFVAALDGIVEHTPAIAAEAWSWRPFADVDELHAAMTTVMTDLDMPNALELIRAHPRLGSRRPMAELSVGEQAGAGITAADESARARLDELNDAYDERFGFPFVIAVKGLGPDEITAALNERLTHDADTERREAIAQISRIAGFRLHDLLSPSTAEGAS